MEVSVAPDQGYGRRDDRLVQIVPRGKFEGVGDLKPGMQVRASGPQGARVVTVVRIDRDFITVDANHPLAGRTLHFAVVITEVRKATHEEVSHGLAHAPGAHQH